MIKPSTKLKVITVHKLQDLTCLRRYFWHWILNLEPKRLNLAFWWGGVIGAGFAAVLLGHHSDGILEAIEVESKKRVRRHTVTLDDEREMEVQKQLIWMLIEAARPICHRQGLRLKKAEEKVCFRLTGSPVWFYGKLDGVGVHGKKSAIIETKSASTINDDYLNAIVRSRQVYSYAVAKSKKGNCPAECCYCIFHKPMKRVKQNQSINSFLAEMQEDIQKRAIWYFRLRPYTLSKNVILHTEKTLESSAKMLLAIYKSLGKDLLQPYSWPEADERQCLTYGGCQYLLLCQSPDTWQVCAKHFYQQREFLYEIENEEVQNERI